MTELWQLSASELAAQVRSRNVSAREVAEDALRRLDAVNPRINAVVECRPDAVLRQADNVDAALSRGDDPGPLAGVPVTVKINTDVAGYATTNGTRLQEQLIAPASSPAVDNLLRAGAVMLGRSNSPTFALRWFTSNLLHGKTLNPRDAGLTPGGSSGGGAAAVAAGIGSFAVGSDIGGSLRHPAYACGIHGLRPSFGRVPAYNASSPERGIGPQLMSATGPMARSIQDLSLTLAVMSAADPRDPWYVPLPLEGSPTPRHAALCLRPGGMPIAPEVEAALWEARDRLVDAGWHVEEIQDTPSVHEAAEIQEQLWLGDGFAALVAAVERDGDPGAKAVVEGVRDRVAALPPDVMTKALVRRATAARQWQAFFQRYPVLLVPVSAELPFPDDLDLQGREGFQRVWDAQLLLRAFPAVGLPGLSVATGTVGSTPIGVQLVAARFREDLCLRAGADIEARSPRIIAYDPA
ncbi:amidase family protein [Dyella telluris]|uniref:Amidase family protein n=1 Tax=Dyella telluris TaxID=2763498 RepID=A0A7G8Q3R8_9GAMM|nr:amidase family protein [Dyella telluris]QNK01426.1 amidase family protein [Dyella telluris]